MSISFKIKVLLQDLKKCKHWFSYCSKTILNDYTKEICAKQVANQSDFLKAFLHLEPLLFNYAMYTTAKSPILRMTLSYEELNSLLLYSLHT